MQPQQFPPQQPQEQQFSQSDHFFGQLLRLLFIHVAESLSPEEFEQLASLNPEDPAATAWLSNHSDGRHSKLISRPRGQQVAPAAAGPARRRGDGSIDAFNQKDATARTRAIFEQALGRKGR